MVPSPSGRVNPLSSRLSTFRLRGGPAIPPLGFGSARSSPGGRGHPIPAHNGESRSGKRPARWFVMSLRGPCALPSHTVAVDTPGPGLTSQRRLLLTSIPANRIASTGVSSRYIAVTPRSTGIGSDRTLAWPIRSARNKYVPARVIRKSNRPAASVRRQST